MRGGRARETSRVSERMIGEEKDGVCIVGLEEELGTRERDGRAGKRGAEGSRQFITSPTLHYHIS